MVLVPLRAIVSNSRMMWRMRLALVVANSTLRLSMPR
jgi:hypothetical protein